MGIVERHFSNACVKEHLQQAISAMERDHLQSPSSPQVTWGFYGMNDLENLFVVFYKVCGMSGMCLCMDCLYLSVCVCVCVCLKGKKKGWW